MFSLVAKVISVSVWKQQSPCNFLALLSKKLQICAYLLTRVDILTEL